jgi:hypothetical protein
MEKISVTHEHKEQQLITLYEKLALWHPDRFDIIFFIYNSLNIINHMCEHDRYVKSLAKSLRLITKSHTPLAYTMKESFAYAEADLPLALRGFQNLFTSILEDNDIRIDTQNIILNIPNKYKNYAFIFQELIHKFDAYEELDLLCNFDSPDVLAVMFLWDINKIFDKLNLPENIIPLWLKSLRVNNNIINSYDTKINFENIDNLVSKELLIIFLCFCYTHHVILKYDVARNLNSLLKDSTLPSLAFLVESGFVGIEN